jgi:hypothetical protein
MVNNWYATPMLASPMTLGLVTKHSHLPLLESFIDAPHLHRKYSRTASMRGAPFIDYDGDPADVAQFAARTVERCVQPLRFADAVDKLYESLVASATGASLRPIYQQIDHDVLRESVELNYDLSKQPGLRIIESALYRSPTWDKTLQSCRLEPLMSDQRPFILSTPLLKDMPGAVELQAPFDDPIWDALFRRGDSTAQGELLERALAYLPDPRKNLARLESLLCGDVARARARANDAVPENSVRIRYFGHACVLMESNRHSILIDPLVGYPGESQVDHFTYDDLPASIDHVLITHPHPDHLVLEALLQLRHKIGCVVVGRASGGNLQDVSPQLLLKHCGFPNVVELGEYEELVFAGGRIVGAPFYGEHADLDIRSKILFGVALEHATCAFFADSNPPFPECYRNLREIFPSLDCMFLGMECVGAPASWAYGPLLQQTLTRGEDQSRRLDGSDSQAAIQLMDYLDPQRMFVYAMGAEPWVSHISSIVYSEELTQFQEARKLEAAAMRRNRHAQVLYGKMELSIRK